MKCTTARKWIGEALDGTLGPKKTNKLGRHCEVCVDCRQIRDDFRSIVENASELETPSPGDDLWPRIAAEMNENGAAGAVPSRRKRKDRLGLIVAPAFAPVLRFAAVSMTLLIVAAAAFFGVRQFRKTPPSFLDKSMAVTIAKLQEAQTYYHLAIKALDDAIAAQKADLDPGVIEVFQGNRKAVDTSIKLCEQDVAGDPENVEAHSMLLGAYHKKLNLLNELLAAKKASPMSAVKSVL